jgi:hypothetical protein
MIIIIIIWELLNITIIYIYIYIIKYRNLRNHEKYHDIIICLGHIGHIVIIIPTISNNVNPRLFNWGGVPFR